mmetsp:Transcript_18129/g.70084  ORF Transcript_18129/g.70084 Transcript_18129/m.70084 type:complete len:223 (-) Transcript_18129:737-1405(-)
MLAVRGQAAGREGAQGRNRPRARPPRPLDHPRLCGHSLFTARSCRGPVPQRAQAPHPLHPPSRHQPPLPRRNPQPYDAEGAQPRVLLEQAAAGGDGCARAQVQAAQDAARRERQSGDGHGSEQEPALGGGLQTRDRALPQSPLWRNAGEQSHLVRGDAPRRAQQVPPLAHRRGAPARRALRRHLPSCRRKRKREQVHALPACVRDVRLPVHGGCAGAVQRAA